MCSATPKTLRQRPSSACGNASRTQEKQEKAARTGGKPKGNGRSSALAGVPVGLPALTRALKLQQKAGKVGFDWNDAMAVLAKIREEADEIAAEIASGDRNKAAAEVGDLLFAVVNLARHLNIDPEAAVRATNIKFERRFGAIESALAKLREEADRSSSLAEMDALWNKAKAAEKSKPAPRLKAAAKNRSRRSRNAAAARGSR